MLLRRLALLTACGFFAFYAPARADDSDAIRTMLGIATMPNAAERDVFVGTLPKGMLLIPQPGGLALLGSIASRAADGKTTGEILFYQAPAGSVPDVIGYERQLNSQGWNIWSAPGSPAAPFLVAAMNAGPRWFCKFGSPTVTVRLDGQYLVVQANAAAGICGLTYGANGVRRAAVLKAPYPMFLPPDGAVFVGSAKQMFNGASHLAAISVVSTQSSGVLLAALAKQMTDAGWKPRAAAAADADSQAFTTRDSNGVDWVAALTVVPVANGMYLFTASAFTLSETTDHSVATR